MSGAINITALGSKIAQEMLAPLDRLALQDRAKLDAAAEAIRVRLEKDGDVRSIVALLTDHLPGYVTIRIKSLEGGTEHYFHHQLPPPAQEQSPEPPLEPDETEAIDRH